MRSDQGRASRRWTRRRFLHEAGIAGLGLVASPLAGAAGRSPFPEAGDAPLQAHLMIDVERRLGTIDPKIYGNFIEHLGRCIYGGVYDENSPLADADGLRKDVLDAARRLRVTQLRWPGGNFVSGYHWEDGIGPRDSRPARYDLAWLERESNRYGTDEFILTCRKLGADPYICVNMGSGTLLEAARWVEYCNHPGGTALSDLRRKNGHAQPHGVKLWGLGNEMYGPWQIGHKGVAEFAKASLEFAKVMKGMDPGIKLVACGNGEPEWDRPVLEQVVNHVDYIAAHHYTVTDDLKDYYEIVASTVAMERTIRASALTAGTVSARARKSPPVAVAFDEWNILNNWSDGGKRDDVHKFEVAYCLRDALWVGAALNVLQRNCRTVGLANLAQLVNVIAPMSTSPAGLLLRTTYYPLELYANRSGPVALEVPAASPRFETRNFGAQDYLDASATFDEEKRRVTLAVVNRRKEGDVVGTIQLLGTRAKPGGRAWIISGAHPEAANTFEDPRAVTTREVPFAASGAGWEYRFPRHSITWLEFDLERDR